VICVNSRSKYVTPVWYLIERAFWTETVHVWYMRQVVCSIISFINSTPAGSECIPERTRANAVCATSRSNLKAIWYIIISPKYAHWRKPILIYDTCDKSFASRNCLFDLVQTKKKLIIFFNNLKKFFYQK